MAANRLGQHGQAEMQALADQFKAGIADNGIGPAEVVLQAGVAYLATQMLSQHTATGNVAIAGTLNSIQNFHVR